MSSVNPLSSQPLFQQPVVEPTLTAEGIAAYFQSHPKPPKRKPHEECDGDRPPKRLRGSSSSADSPPPVSVSSSSSSSSSSSNEPLIRHLTPTPPTTDVASDTAVPSSSNDLQEVLTRTDALVNAQRPFSPLPSSPGARPSDLPLPTNPPDISTGPLPELAPPREPVAEPNPPAPVVNPTITTTFQLLIDYYLWNPGLNPLLNPNLFWLEIGAFLQQRQQPQNLFPQIVPPAAPLNDSLSETSTEIQPTSLSSASAKSPIDRTISDK